MHISCIIFAPLWGLFLSSHILRICQWVLWFKHKFSRCDGRRRTFSFSRKICKSAPVLISRTYLRVCRITLFALFDGTPEQLQICSFKRNDSLLPVCWKKDKYQDKDHKSICFCFGTWYNKFAYT